MHKNIIKNKINKFKNNNLYYKLLLIKFFIKNKLNKKDLYKLILLILLIYNLYISIKNKRIIYKYNIDKINFIINDLNNNIKENIK